MNKIFQIARREYLETIKTKAFLLSVILTPIFIIAMGFVNNWIEKDMHSGAKPPRRIALADPSSNLPAELTAAITRYNTANPQRPFTIQSTVTGPDATPKRIEELRRDVLEGRIEGLIVIAQSATAENPEKDTSKYYSKTKNINDLDTFSTIRNFLSEVVVDRRYKQHNLSPQLVAQLSRPVPLEAVEVGAKTGTANQTRNPATLIMVPFFFMFMMFMGIVGTSQGMLTSVIEEKSSRVMEVLLAAVSPYQLMYGKILGLVGVGLTLIGVWGAAAAGAATRYGITGIVHPALLVYFIIFFLLGFTAIAAIYAGIGSACNTLKEAQSLMGPVMLLVILPMIVWMPIVQKPGGPIALVLSYVPTTSSMVMILRICADPDMPFLQIAGPIAALLVSVPLVAWAAGKIFRTGVLMYGKPPTLREMLKWVRYR